MNRYSNIGEKESFPEGGLWNSLSYDLLGIGPKR